MTLSDKLFYVSAALLISAQLAIPNVGSYKLAQNDFNNPLISDPKKIENAQFLKQRHESLNWYDARKITELGYVVAANKYLNEHSKQ